MADFIVENNAKGNSDATGDGVKSSSSSTLPAILILGGCGFVGRNLVHLLVTQKLAVYIKVADKAMPEMSYFHSKFMEAFQSPLVKYEQADLTKEAHITRAFSIPPEYNKPCYDVVINLAAETRQGQPEALYASRCTQLATFCAQKAVDVGVPRFIQVSTGQVYQCSSSFSPNDKPADEKSPIDPWTEEARCTYQAERAVLRHRAEMELVALRLAFVYGEGDAQMIMTRAVCGALYTELREEMTLLWGGQLKINTVHVADACGAILHAMHREHVPRSTVWNVCDKSDTDQAKISAFIKSVFKIKCGFYGRIMSNVASLRLQDVVNSANEKHLKPWNDLCMRDNITNTPLSPYMCPEWLDCHHLHMSGAAIESTGFKYQHPVMTEELFRASIRHAIECRTFPGSCYSD